MCIRDRGRSSLVQSLDGNWEFAYSVNAKSRPVDFYRDNAGDTEFETIRVPGHIELSGYDKIHYINTMYPWEGKEYHRGAYSMEATGAEKGMFSEAEYNPVGSYIKYFDLDKSMCGKRIHICFEGVEEAMYLWLNGQFVGYAEDSFTPSEFDLTPFIREKGNVHQHLDLIAGLPYEDYDSFGRSFDEIYELKPNQLQLGFLKVLKGSYMFEHAAEYGIVYHDKPPYEVMSTKWLSFDDVIKIKRVEDMLEVYYNSGQFEITMKLMECIFDSAFEFFQELGDFYEANGYFGMSHSRIRRCEILLEFLALHLHVCDSDAMTSVVLSENHGDRDNTDFDENTIDRDNTDFDENAQIYSMIQESLIFDLYYRENCKSRPVWATDIGSFKHMTHAYCKNGKLSHVEPFHYIFPDKHTRKLDELPKYHKEPVWALFHYDMRDPLDHQALVEYIE